MTADLPRAGIHTTAKTYRLPVSVTTMGLIYNKDMFKSAGIVDEKGEAKAPRNHCGNG
ncbi:MAG: extracellular solute-binding protein [Clostridiales bacterium]|nr:MAG: extracellular solute-binding protein [Clostridiales bacterium]